MLTDRVKQPSNRSVAPTAKDTKPRHLSEKLKSTQQIMVTAKFSTANINTDFLKIVTENILSYRGVMTKVMEFYPCEPGLIDDKSYKLLVT